MAESLNSKRVIFPSGKQREFLLQVKEKLALDMKSLAGIAGTGVRNLSTWKREETSMTLFAVKQLCKKSGVSLPADIEIKERYWYVKEAAIKGGRARYQKYGVVALNEDERKKKWR